MNKADVRMVERERCTACNLVSLDIERHLSGCPARNIGSEISGVALPQCTCHWTAIPPEKRCLVHRPSKPERYSDISSLRQQVSYYLQITMSLKKKADMAAAHITELFKPYLRTTEPVSIKDAIKAIKEHPLRAGGIIDLDEAAQCCAQAWRLPYVD